MLMPLILHCPRDICLERTQERHAGNPTYYDAADVYRTNPQVLAVGEYLDNLTRPDIHRIDASRAPDDVYRDITQYLAMRLQMAP